MAMETREVLTMLAAAQNKSRNKMTVKLNVLILTAREWLNNDGVKNYTYTSFCESADGIIEFHSTRLLPKGKPSEILIVISGFKAYEAFK